MSANVEETIRKLIEKHGADELRRTLDNQEFHLRQSKCTIIADEMVHEIPDRLIVGQKYVFSHGNLPIDCDDDLRNALVERVKLLKNFLSTQEFKSIRLIYSGHAVLAAVVKFSVYRISHIETEDVVYFGGKGYLNIGTYLNDYLRP
tara:strand:- start:532 stop:972 length:441 start_codon:yes stop_codon:yes gene_type:complete